MILTIKYKKLNFSLFILIIFLINKIAIIYKLTFYIIITKLIN